MKIIFILIAAVSFSSNCLAKSTYTKEIDFCPVSMSYENLGSLIGKIRTIVKSANNGQEAAYSSESISIESDSIKVDLKKGFTNQELADGPSNATNIRYRLYIDGEQSINEVTLYLTDGLRSVEIKGISKDHIKTLESVIAGHFDEAGCAIGGSNQRLFGGMAILAAALILGLLQSMGVKLSTRASMLNLGVIILLYILLWVPDWESIFPGTLITISDEGFFSRNAAAIGALGVVIGIAGLVSSIYFGVTTKSPEPNTKDTDDSDSEDQA